MNRPPILGTIPNETVNENVAITQVNADDTTNGDSDPDNDVITFSCYFDTTVGGGVDNTNDCSTLPGGGSFDAATGILNWTPNYFSNDILNATPKYEIRITGTANGDSDDEIFVITVNNIDRAPSVSTIGNQSVDENVAISEINATDDSGGDTDIDGDVVTYSYFDTNLDGTVDTANTCSSLPGTVSFVASTGVFNWEPNNEAVTTAQGTLSYEISIVSSSNGTFR